MEKIINLLKKNQKGITVLELLLALSLLSMVIILATSVHIFSQKQMNNQSSEVQNQSNVRLALNIVTKEIRKAAKVSITNNVLTINETDTYKLENSILKKNNQDLITNIQTFSVTMSGDKVTVIIANIPSASHPQTTLSATIYLRK